jgi:hypothetical protein
MLEPDHSNSTKKGRVQMGLQRTLSTEKYQSLVMHYDIDEEIEWRTLEEREQKVMNWQRVVVNEFKKILDNSLEELKLSHKRAYFVDHTDKDLRPDPSDGIDSLDDLGSLV